MGNFRNLVGHSRIARLVMVAALGVSGTANAVIVSSGSPITSFSWSFDTGISLLTGSGSIVISDFNSIALTTSITLNNTSTIGGAGGERLTAFGFGIDPNATGVSFLDVSDGGMVSASASSIPSLATIEICAYGGSNCAGGSNGGIFAGTSDSFAVVLAGTWGSSVNIDPIGFKYQTGYGSFEFTTSSSGSSSTTSSTSSGTVSEPSTSSMALLALGLLAFALRRTRGVEQNGVEQN